MLLYINMFCTYTVYTSQKSATQFHLGNLIFLCFIIYVNVYVVIFIERKITIYRKSSDLAS